MINKKSFLIGLATGVLSVTLIEGMIWGGMSLYENHLENEENQVYYDEGLEDEEIVDSSGVFADNGNPIIKDTEEKYSIEVIPPEGYTIGEDYESAYGTEYYNEDQSIRLEYSIENYFAEDMESYYEFKMEYMNPSEDAQYSDITTTPVNSMEVNGYTVNYLSLSYTFNETEHYTEYCAYVMLDEETEYMCGIYGETGDVSEDLIKECFNATLPIAQ